MIFFFFPFNFFFFLRVCLSGCAHGVHANRKVLAVALFQRHSKRSGKRKRLKGMWMEEETGARDGRITHFFWFPYHLFPILCFLPSFLMLSLQLLHLFLFHPIQFSLPLTQSKVVPKTQALRLRIYPPRVLLEDFLCWTTFFFFFF